MAESEPAKDDLRGAVASLKERPAVVRWLDDGSSYLLTRFSILRLLGIVYFIVFFSSLEQAPALIGEHGLLPMHGYLSAVARASGSRAMGFLNAPTLFWLGDSDGALIALCSLGVGLSLAVALGVTNAGVMLVLWMLQTSLHNVGQIFWGYGWEIQLLETGMLAAVLCPMRTAHPLASAPPLPSVVLFRWLAVRIMIGAGLIKLRGDPCWRELTCLVTHYETQPNPSPLSWCLHQMPRGFHVLGTAFNHFVEVVVPLFVFGPRRVRRAAGCLLVLFQVILIASGNLSFLNWLTIVPALACFDDAFLARLLPKRDREGVLARAHASSPPSRLHRRFSVGYAIAVAVLSIGPVLNLFSSSQAMNASFDPLHLVNTYGAFGTVSRVRDEIILQGTRDEEPTDAAHWQEYEFPCKPGDPTRRPCLVTPYHYRLDWQMWFAAMSSYDEEPWIVVLVDKLLRGDRTVTKLLAKDPFTDSPPRWVRAELYRYEFTRSGEGAAWWRRRRLGEYMRPVALGDLELEAFLRQHTLR
jgi:lipase maturation factor